MDFKSTTSFKDYELVDSGNGRRLERFGKYILDRPDPQIIWPKGLGENEWIKADAYFRKIENDKGVWEIQSKRAGEQEGERLGKDSKWVMEYDGIKFYAKLSPFKHTGVFPEQASQWIYLREKCGESFKADPLLKPLLVHTSRVQGGRLLSDQLPYHNESKQPNILNLFGYTGIATLFVASAGAKVTHVDASYPAIGWARENQELSGLKDKPIRWILDDAIKFCQREVNRGNFYDGVIMDPPVYGHGPNGERWSFNSDFPKLMEIVAKLLTPTPLFVIVNAYAVSMSAITLENTLRGHLGHFNGTFNHGELTLIEKAKGRLLSTGIWAGWER